MSPPVSTTLGTTLAPLSARRVDALLWLQRAYLVLVAGFTAWVGSFGSFWPQEIMRALPWPVPPLHARFIGALYLGATTFLLLSALAPTRRAMRTVLDIAWVWTGWLLLVSVWHISSFDVARVQAAFWWVAYVTFPFAALALSRLRLPPGQDLASMTQAWVPQTLAVLGVALVAMAAGLTLWPAGAAWIWPWRISPFLAQVYAGPLLGWGAGLLWLARRKSWSQALAPLLGLTVTAALALLGSLWHLALFTAGSPSKLIWFGLLWAIALWSAVLAAMATAAVMAARSAARAPSSSPT